MVILTCLSVFAAAYLLQITYITVFYHRGIAHQAVGLSPWVKTIVIHTGNWITGLDPKGWSCMHRMHHEFSDTQQDPHSPLRWGLFGTAFGQLESYKRTLVKLHFNDPEYSRHVDDLDFDIHWLNRHQLWMLPYILHACLGAGIGAVAGNWVIGAAYWLGMMSHPVQGWMVNAFGHAVGGRNFDLDDNSRNNNLVAWLIFGEGYQNNHHRFPDSPKFSFRWWEVDTGYGLCRIFEIFGVVRINRAAMIPAPRKLLAQPG